MKLTDLAVVALALGAGVVGHFKRRETLSVETNVSGGAVRELQTKGGLIRKHWRGELTLPQSYWGIFVLLNFLLVGLGYGLGSALQSFNVSPIVLGITLVLFLTFLCACNLWQLVGVWRSAGNHMQSTGRRTWGLFARLGVIIGAGRLILDFITVVAPMLSESLQLAVGCDHNVAYQLRLLRDGSEVELSGGMPFGTADALKKLLDAAPGVQVVRLNSSGGRFGEGLQIYQLLRDRKLVVYTDKYCASACTIAFLGGTQRLLSARAKLGFHGLSFGGLGQQQIPEINAGLRRTLQANGAPSWFIEKALNTSPQSMWYPMHNELITAKIVTSVVDPDVVGRLDVPTR
jgi:hypothetical protein